MRISISYIIILPTYYFTNIYRVFDEDGLFFWFCDRNNKEPQCGSRSGVPSSSESAQTRSATSAN
jgi:hypothetical protein